MRPGKLSNSSSSQFQLWRSPVPYVFAGLAVLMGLIFVALVVLACSHCRSSSSDGRLGSSRRPCSTGDPAEAAEATFASETEARVVVVIMAGDCKPTFLAKPFDSLGNSQTSEC